MLKLKNINKTYVMGSTEVKALKGVSLEFNSSEFVSVLGPSGCGKTTLLNIIGGLDRYTDGDLIIKGKSTKDFKDSDWDSYRNHSIGFVFQSYNLIPHLTVLGNVELALTLSGVSTEERRKRAETVLERVGLSDQISKKPNQLSGGQMQRVAIARALVNNPEILLTDEPTGALDTETSIQIMELIKEIAKERLVIMVTHNPELAKKYSTRIIKLLDGNVISDSNPSTEVKEILAEQKVNKGKKNEKTSMSFFTALSLSFKNLVTKKVRTIITSIAGSIGIIGIALVLSLSNGFGKYIDKMQSDTLTSYPLTINESDFDYSFLMNFNKKPDLESYTAVEKIFVEKLFEKFKEAIIDNNISDEFLDYLKAMDKELYNSIGYSYGLDINNYFYTNINYTNGSSHFASVNYLYKTVMQALSTQGMSFSYTIFQEMVDNLDLLNSQYDIIQGEMPKAYDEIVVVVDKYNRISDFTLVLLGYKALSEFDQNSTIETIFSDETTDYSFDEIVNKEFWLYDNTQIYTESSDGKSIIPNLLDQSSGTKVKVTGIIRPNEKTVMSSLYSGIGYTKALTEHLMAKNLTSDIIKWMEKNPTLEPISGKEYSSDITKIQKLHNNAIRDYGGNPVPESIMIYPVNFESKTAIKAYLDNYTTVHPEENKVKYTDMMEIFISTMNTMVDAISYVLIAFTAISLVVSSVMIGIITYVSVVERTKEIGVLRSIGARKKDISRVFNAETFIIGLFAGLIGVTVAALMAIPVNLIITSLVDNIGNLALPSLLHAVILVVISVMLTLIAGLIPSRIAAKKDPVVALRNE